MNGEEQVCDISEFEDSNKSKYGFEKDGLLVVGECEYLDFLEKEVLIVTAIGATKVKRKAGEKFASFII